MKIFCSGHLITVLLSFCLLLSASSCGSKKQFASTVSPSQSQPAALTHSDCRQSLSAYSSTWQRLSLPVTLRLREPSSISVSGTAVMERGKSITISLRFLGMEMAVMHLTNDSVVALDKYHDKYVAESLHRFLGGFPVNISNVQDALLGRPFLLGSSRPVADEASSFDFEVVPASDCWTMIPARSPSNMEYGFTFDRSMQLLGLIVRSGSGLPVTVTYGAPQSTNYGPMASSTSVEAAFGKTQIEASLEWTLRKAKWDSYVKTREIIIPSKYQRIPAASLLKILSSM